MVYLYGLGHPTVLKVVVVVVVVVVVLPAATEVMFENIINIILKLEIV